MFNSEESSESWSSQKAGMYEIISQSMERGDEVREFKYKHIKLF